MLKFQEQLAVLMAEDGLTQSALAKAMNTSGSKLSLYLSGKSTPTYKFFVALAEYFNCSADFLAGLTDYPQRNITYKPVQPFGERLRRILKDRKISQYSFISDTKISWSIFYNWLIGKTLPSIDNLIKLSNYLGVTIDYLLGREN